MDTTAAAAHARITALAEYLDINAEGWETEGCAAEARAFRTLAAKIRTALAAQDVTALVKLCAHKSLTDAEQIPADAVYDLLGADDEE